MYLVMVLPSETLRLILEQSSEHGKDDSTAQNIEKVCVKAKKVNQWAEDICALTWRTETFSMALTSLAKTTGR